MGKGQQPIRQEQLQGFKHFKKLMPMLQRLHDDATDRDKAGNRVLHYDQYIGYQLLFFFNPIVTSVRGIIQAGQLKKVQQLLGVRSTSLGSFSESGSVFDPELLASIVAELATQVQPLPHAAGLEALPGRLTAVDGTELSALSRLCGLAIQGRHIKLHTHFEPLRGIPVNMDLTSDKGSEVNNLMKNLEADRVYVHDRGYAAFRLFQGIVDIGSWFVGRIRDNSAYELIEDRPLTSEAKAAGVISDQVVWLGCEGKRDELKQPTRVIKIACKPHPKRGRHGGPGGPRQGEYLLVATNLLDLPAELIALIYRYRWTIELFFRFFKHVLGCRHLLSHRPGGIKIQVYLAMIVCMLIALWTGRKPTLRTVEMLQFYFTGWADDEELEAHIAGLKKLDA